MDASSLLQGAYDMHVHAAPDVKPRAMDAVALGRAANAAGMAGLVLKDHAVPTTGRAYVLNQLLDGTCRFYGALVLNPTLGFLNPAAVRAALDAGAAMVFLPTYGAAHHVRMFSSGKGEAYPQSQTMPEGLALSDDGNFAALAALLTDVARHDAVFATGHMSPAECLTAINMAKDAGVQRMLITHASMPRLGMTPDQQREAAAMGAFIEHSFVACTHVLPDPIPVELIRDHIRHVGVEHCVLSSDLGQVANGAPVERFAAYLDALHHAGLGWEELRVMVRDNPHHLLEERKQGAA